MGSHSGLAGGSNLGGVRGGGSEHREHLWVGQHPGFKAHRLLSAPHVSPHRADQALLG